MFKTDLKQKKRIILPQFYYKVGENKKKIYFLSVSFCIVHFYILGQTEKMATSFLAVEMKKSRMMCEKNNQ